MRVAGFASRPSGLPTSVPGPSGELSVDLGRVEFERVDKAAVVKPVATRPTRALGAPAPHEASAATVPADTSIAQPRLERPDEKRMILSLGHQTKRDLTAT